MRQHLQPDPQAALQQLPAQLLNDSKAIARGAGVAMSPTWVVVALITGLAVVGLAGGAVIAGAGAAVSGIVTTIVVGVLGVLGFGLVVAICVWAYTMVVPVKRGDYHVLLSQAFQLKWLALLFRYAGGEDKSKKNIIDVDAIEQLKNEKVLPGHSRPQLPPDSPGQRSIAAKKER